MIPSRPLRFGEILGQTFSIFGKTFARYALLWIVFIIPGATLTTFGIVNLIETGVRISQRHTGFNDQDLLTLRDRMRDELYRSNPNLRNQLEELPDSRGMVTDSGRKDTLSSNKPASIDSSTNSARADSALTALSARRPWHASEVIVRYGSEFVSESTALIAGVLLLVFGLIVLTGGVTELSCRAFEERRLEIKATLAATLKRHIWRILALIFIWTLASIVLSIVRGWFGAGSISNLFFFLLTCGEMYVSIRVALSVPALVSEELGPIKAMSRSWQLTEHNWWRIFGIVIGFGVLIIGVGVAVLFFSSLFVAGSAFLWWKDFLTAPTVSVAGFVQGMSSFLRSMALFLSIPTFILFPLSPIFSTVLYYDLRTRREGPLTYSNNGAEPLPVNPAPVMWQP